DQQGHRRLGFFFGVVKKYGDDRGGSLAALLTYYGFLSLFPLLLLLVTGLGFVVGRDPALQRRLLHSALAEFPIIGDQIQHNIHALRANGFGLVVGVVGLCWGGLGVTQAGQHAMQEIWNIPGVQRPGFPVRLVRGLKLLGVLVAGIAWTGLQALGGYLVAHQLHHASQVYGFFGVVLGLVSWIYLLAQITIYSAELSAVRVQRLWPRSIVQPPLTPEDEKA